MRHRQIIANTIDGCEVSPALLADNNLAWYIWDRNNKETQLLGLVWQMDKVFPLESRTPEQDQLLVQLNSAVGRLRNRPQSGSVSRV